MSRENVEIVPSWYERWNAGDRETFDDEIHADAEVHDYLGRPTAWPGGSAPGFREIGEQSDEWIVMW
jgi:hypothetical protein